MTLHFGREDRKVRAEEGTHDGTEQTMGWFSMTVDSQDARERSKQDEDALFTTDTNRVAITGSR